MTTASLALATVVWAPALHVFFIGDAGPDGRLAVATELLDRQRTLMEADGAREAARARMRAANAEWDFMGRTFLVLALANHALSTPGERARDLALVDQILEETLALEDELGQAHFLMDYVHTGSFVDDSGRSVFVDGEIAMMLAARQRVEVSERWREPLEARVAAVSAQMMRGPVMSAESYPDECWTFCNTLALAAIRTSDSVTGEDHGDLLRGWARMARRRLTDPETGMLVSSFRRDGTHLDGPEGSSIFMVAHALTVIDPALARDQYRRAREHLGVSFLGFGWAREWPASWVGPMDIDSGPIVPIVEASAGASGTALLGAATFGDEAWQVALHTSVAFAAFPVRDAGGLRFAASNQVGDAVLVYAAMQGPLFSAVGPPPSTLTAADAHAVTGGGR